VLGLQLLEDVSQGLTSILSELDSDHTGQSLVVNLVGEVSSVILLGK
jgi:hypothetical protein